MEDSRRDNTPSQIADLHRLREELLQMALRVNRPSDEAKSGHPNDQQASLVVRGR